MADTDPFSENTDPSWIDYLDEQAIPPDETPCDFFDSQTGLGAQEVALVGMAQQARWSPGTTGPVACGATQEIGTTGSLAHP